MSNDSLCPTEIIIKYPIKKVTIMRLALDFITADSTNHLKTKQKLDKNIQTKDQNT